MTKTKTIPFDAAEFLDDEEAIAIYLSEAIAAGNTEHFQEAVHVAARARGMAQIAESTGLGRESLYKALRPGAQPRFDTVVRVLGALGVRMNIEPVAHARESTQPRKRSSKRVPMKGSRKRVPKPLEHEHEPA